MRTFKAMNSDMTCLTQKYEVGESYNIYGKIIPCENGFHSCKELSRVFEYYPYSNEMPIVCEVEIPDNSISLNDKMISSKIKILRILDIDEIKKEFTRIFATFSSDDIDNPINLNSSLCYHYARIVVEGPWKEGEKSIALDSSYSCHYSYYVLNGRFPTGENMISSNSINLDWYNSFMLYTERENEIV